LFSGLVFLIIALLVTALSTENIAVNWITSPALAMGISLVTFTVLWSLIYLASAYFQRWIKRNKSISYYIINFILIVFLCFNNFVLSTQRIFGIFPAFLTGIYSLFLYFGGLSAYYSGNYYQRLLYPESEVRSRWQYTSRQLRVWLPFVIPFIIFSLIADIITLLPQNEWTDSILMPGNDPISALIFLAFTATMILLIMIFLPYFIQKVWLCETIQDKDTLQKLQAICRKANFRCADIRTWTVMNHFHTAAIIGVIPRFRYVMFTKRLLNDLPEESIEAILVHEIGHSYRKHLLTIPFIILGMFVSAGLFSSFFSEDIYRMILEKKAVSSSVIWDISIPLSLVIPYALIIGVYFRIVFGYFSRLFERQADLHPFVVGTRPEHMIQALDNIGTASGNTHDHPSWHHFSIRERINFLEKAIQDPSLVNKHHSKVRRSIIAYLIIFVIATSSLFYIGQNNTQYQSEIYGDTYEY